MGSAEQHETQIALITQIDADYLREALGRIAPRAFKWNNYPGCFDLSRTVHRSSRLPRDDTPSYMESICVNLRDQRDLRQLLDMPMMRISIEQ